MEIIHQILLVVLLLSLPFSSTRNPLQQPPASEFPPLPPPPSPSPQCTPMLPREIAYLHCSRPPPLTFPLHPATTPGFPPPLPPSPVGPPPQPYQSKYLLSPPPPPQRPPMSPETTDLYYLPPPPLMTFLPPVVPFPLQPPRTAEFSSPALSSFIVHLLSGLGSAAFIALLVAVCKMILMRWAAANHPVQVGMQGVQVEMEMQGVQVEMEMQDLPLHT